MLLWYVDTDSRQINGLIWFQAGGTTFLSALILKETYAPRLLEAKTRSLINQTGVPHISKHEDGLPPRERFRLALIRPTKLLLKSPIVLLTALFVSVIYSYLYLLFTTFTEVFEGTYGFNVGEAGLAYLGLGVGFCIAQFSIGILSDRYLQRQKARHGAAKPEDRLPPLIAGSILVPIGLIWYGWATEYRIHWIVPIVGTGFCGIGIFYVFIPVQMYLVDAFTLYAASAIGANTVVRSIFGTTIPLAGPALYARLGLGWGNSLLAFLALLFVPCAFWLWKNGQALRENKRFQPKM